MYREAGPIILIEQLANQVCILFNPFIHTRYLVVCLLSKVKRSESFVWSRLAEDKRSKGMAILSWSRGLFHLFVGN